MSERTDSLRLARKLLDEPNCDPDDDLRVLSRQLLRRVEVVDKLEKHLAASHDPMADMIQANRDIVLKKHEEAIQLIRNCVVEIKKDIGGHRYATELKVLRIEAILLALSMFHPMHGESWSGWPK